MLLSGSLQVFSVDEAVVAPVAAKPKKPGLFDDLRDREASSSLGVPTELISTVRGLAEDENDLERTEDNLPPDAYEALYMRAAGYSYEQVMAELDRKDEDAGVSANDFEVALQTDESKRKYWVAENVG